MAMRFASKTPVNASPVNWLPWSVLKSPACRICSIGLLQRLDAKAGLQSVIDARMGERTPAEPIDDGDEIDEAARHRDIGNIRRPDLIWADRPSRTRSRIRVNLVAR